MRKLAKMILLPLAALIIGCATHYYQVTDPATEKDYYTERVERKQGSVTFKDANSQRTVTLQASEIIKITKDQFKAETGKSRCPL